MNSVFRAILFLLPPAMLGGCGDSSSEDTSNTPAPATQTQCEAGTYDDDGDSSTACVAWSDCKPGEFVAAAGTETTDRVCTPCWAGTFNDAINAPSCTVWSSCVAGEYMAEAGTRSADRKCEPCSAGTYSQAPNSSKCVPQGQCPAGTVQTAAASDQSPPECQPCRPGMYCAGGEEPEIECAPGTWDDDLNPASACASWTDCAEGEYVAAEATATRDRVCGACGAGTFSATPNATSCAPWTDCSAGECVEAEGPLSAIGCARRASQANSARPSMRRVAHRGPTAPRASMSRQKEPLPAIACAQRARQANSAP